MKQPKIGDEIYIGSSYSIDHEWDDVKGGLTKIVDIKLNLTPSCLDYNRIFVVVEGINTSYNYQYLMEHQEEWKKTYKNNKAKYSYPEYFK